MIKMIGNRKSWPLIKSTKSDTTFNTNHSQCKQLNNWLQLQLSDFTAIVLKVILCFFLIPIIITSSLSSSTLLVNAKRLNSGIHGTKHHPKFIGSVENVTIPIGKEATLKCNVENLGNHRVAWLRADPEVTLLTLETSIIVKDNRLRVTNDINKLWSLHIKNVTENDRGTYMCEVNSEPMISRKAYLDILVPPSIVDNETSSDTVLDERSKLSLHCKANGYPTPVIVWRREDGKNLSTGFIGASKVEGEYLNISQVTRDDMGAYLCIASNGVLPSRSKRIFVQVNFPPKIRAGQLSFGAAKGSHVDLQCEVEASPKPMTSWNRKDQMLFGSKKYKIEEIVNLYNVTMKLRINDLEEKDFAAYKCVAKNTLGEREGRLRVYEIPSTTPFPVPVRSTASTHKPSRKVFTASTATIFSPGNNRKDEKVKSNSMKEMAQKRESLNGNNVNKKSNYDQTNVFSGSNEIKSSGVMIKQLGYNGLKILTMAGFITLFTW